MPTTVRGDFRYTPSMLREPCLRTNTTIDVLYLDNTNCDPNRILPSRQRATQQIKDIIRSHHNHNVVIGLYALGKESLLLELAMEFKTWIEVSFERMETLKALELPNVFTTETGAGRIRAVDQSEICFNTMQQWNKEQPTLAIMPTSRPLVSFHSKVHVVPYSDHSSYQELEDFVAALKPTSLLPIIGNCVPESLSALLPGKKRREILVPESVRHYMLNQPESQNSSSAYTSLHRQHFRPLVPKGVIFESPVSKSRKSCEEACELECLEQEVSEEEMDTENSENSCILIDMSKKLPPDKIRKSAGDTWQFNIASMVSEDRVWIESMRHSQSTQGKFAPGELLTNGTHRITRYPLENNAEIINETASNGNNNSQNSRNENINDDNALSHSDSMSQHSRHEYDSDNSMALLQNIPDNDSCSLCSSMSILREEYVKVMENSILRNLPFREEDMQSWGLLPRSFVQQFPLCPVYDEKEENVADT
ncbi:5' exonuclease Apollo isoform X2 [Channa argus]|uniref:5' exonuclease Apollo isoform X2 n=1 Tax=Channa argus TaxID=215402 RepID=UPI0035206C5A